MVRKSILFILAISLLFSCSENEKTTNNAVIQEQIEQEIWGAIESRFNAWKDNDLQSYMNYYHPIWK